MPSVLVADHPSVRRFVGVVLGLEGYTVFEATNAATAQRILDSRLVDVLLIDPHAAAFGGDAILELLPGLDRAPSTAVFTCSPTYRELERWGALGASFFLSKPFEPQALLDTLEALVAGRALAGSAA